MQLSPRQRGGEGGKHQNSDRYDEHGRDGHEYLRQVSKHTGKPNRPGLEVDQNASAFSRLIFICEFGSFLRMTP